MSGGSRNAALILACAQNRLGTHCLWLVFFRWNEPVPTNRKSASGLSPVVELKNEFPGDIERSWQGDHWRAGEIERSRRIVLDPTDPPLPIFCAKRPSIAARSQLQALGLSERSLAARGMPKSVGDSRQFGNGFRLDLRNSLINFRIAPRR